MKPARREAYFSCLEITVEHSVNFIELLCRAVFGPYGRYTNLKQKLEYIKRPEASASLSSAVDQDNNAFLSFSANKAIKLLKFWNDRHVTIDHSADNGTTWTGGKILTSADFRIVRASGKTMSGSNIVTATVPGLQSGKACVVTCNTTTANHILCAAAIAENTLEVRFANNFDGVATAWISVAFIP